MITGTTLVVTGTSTDVGKTVTVAALAAALMASGRAVAVCKPAQTGVSETDPGDLAEVVRLAGPLPTHECERFRDPLAPQTAAHREGRDELNLPQVIASITSLSQGCDLVLVEGAGGVLVRLGSELTILDVAEAVRAPVLVVTAAGLGTLNHTELTVRAIRDRGLRVAGVVIGAWPQRPDLAATCNRVDLPRITGVPVVGTLPEGIGSISTAQFRADAAGWFDTDWLSGITGFRSPGGVRHTG